MVQVVQSLWPSCYPPNHSVMHTVQPPAFSLPMAWLPLSQTDEEKSNSQGNKSIYRRSERGNSRPWITQTWLDEGSVGHGGESQSTLHFSQHTPHSTPRMHHSSKQTFTLSQYHSPSSQPLSSQQLVSVPESPVLA